jgi:hypothetical protein
MNSINHLSFVKSEAHLTSLGWVYVNVVILRPAENMLEAPDRSIIDAVIRSKFHHWQGEEFPDGMDFRIQEYNADKKLTNVTLINYKIHGLFDNDRLHADHYKLSSYESLLKEVTALISEFNEEEEARALDEKKTMDFIEQYLSPSLVIYHLDLNKESDPDLLARFNPYSKFLGFLCIDRQKNEIVLLEMGDD